MGYKIDMTKILNERDTKFGNDRLERMIQRRLRSLMRHLAWMTPKIWFENGLFAYETKDNFYNFRILKPDTLSERDKDLCIQIRQLVQTIQSM